MQANLVLRRRLRFLAIVAAVAFGGGLSLVAMQANALTGGSSVSNGSYPFVARVEVSGSRACTGALVSPFWILTSKSCFVDGGQTLNSGAPPKAASVTIGRADLTTSAGRVVPVTSLVVHPDRDVVLAKLAVQITDVAPVAVSGTAPTAGELLRTAGYGRTGTEWVPNLQSAAVTVGSVATGSFAWTGQDAATTACQGDTGGPVFRDSAGQSALVGINVVSNQGGCTGSSDGQHGATAVRLDDVKAWIAANTPGLTADFGAPFTSGGGIGGFSLTNPNDQIIAYDYDHSGKQDHIVLYRPVQGAIYILKHNADNSYTQKYATPSAGIGGFSLKFAQDRVIAFDYDHSGKLDHLLLYRPVQGAVFILKHNADNTFSPVYATATAGIGDYDLLNANDQIIAYDYDHSGKQDHLVTYRPGSKIVWILKHGSGSSFSRAYTSNNDGVGGYDMSLAQDRLVAFDFDHTGSNGHLIAYRPVKGIIYIIGRKWAQATSASPGASDGGTLPDGSGTAIVETYLYPGAAEILASLNVRLIGGDGHILLADCATQPVNNIGVIRVWTTEPIGADGDGQICFKVTAATGRLDLEVPGVFEIRGDGQQPGTGHALTAVVKPDDGSATTVTVNPSGSTQVGIGVDADNSPTTLLQLRVSS